MKYYVGLDVGGTYIKSAVVNSNGEILDDKIIVNESFSNSNKETILCNIINIIKERISSLSNCNFSGVGIAFPGPFDYENGVSYIKGINKYENIYGVNVKEEIIRYVKENLKNITNDFTVKFENDIAMFALGEELLNNKKSNKTFALCIGTGCGSAYIKSGEVIKNKWIYSIPYKDGIIDDYISCRGILKIANECGIVGLEVKEIADKALKGEDLAKIVWNRFENNLLEVFKLATEDFKPDRVIIGGQVAKSSELFLGMSIDYFSENNVEVVVSKDTSKSAIVGSVMLFLRGI